MLLLVSIQVNIICGKGQCVICVPSVHSQFILLTDWWDHLFLSLQTKYLSWLVYVTCDSCLETHVGHYDLSMFPMSRPLFLFYGEKIWILFWLVVAQFIFSTMEGDNVSSGVRYSSRDSWKILSIISFAFVKYILEKKHIVIHRLKMQNLLNTSCYFCRYIIIDLDYVNMSTKKLFSPDCQK